MRTATREAMMALVALTFAFAAAPGSAEAAGSPNDTKPGRPQAVRPAPAGKAVASRPVSTRATATAHRPVRYSGPILQCVTFARDASGIHLAGNAHTWWYNARGLFARGERPEVGAVLNFRSSGGMRLGHVSVVSRVVSAREILIDDANWAGPGQRKGSVRRGASVIDVSPNNDWTTVRVANGIGSWGREYPTYGFIYPRADTGGEPGRIEIATAPVLHQAPARSTWAGAVAMQPDAAARLPTHELLRMPSPTSEARWVWVNGRAVSAGN